MKCSRLDFFALKMQAASCRFPFDRFQPGDLESDDHFCEVDDGEAEREKADNDYDVEKGDLTQPTTTEPKL